MAGLLPPRFPHASKRTAGHQLTDFPSTRLKPSFFPLPSNQPDHSLEWSGEPVPVRLFYGVTAHERVSLQPVTSHHLSTSHTPDRSGLPQIRPTPRAAFARTAREWVPEGQPDRDSGETCLLILSWIFNAFRVTCGCEILPKCLFLLTDGHVRPAQRGTSPTVCVFSTSYGTTSVFGIECHWSWEIARGRSKPFLIFISQIRLIPKVRIISL